MTALPPIRTYEVAVYGYGEVRYSARSPGKARAKAWRDFNAVLHPKTFHEFLVISRVRCIPDPPGIGERIMVAGLPATRCIGYGQYVWFMRDDSDVLLCSHPADVTPVARAAA